MNLFGGLCVLFLSTLTCFGQSAKVIALDAQDSARVKSLMEQKAKIDEEIKHARQDIVDNYLMTKKATQQSCGYFVAKSETVENNGYWVVNSGGTINYHSIAGGYCETESEKTAREARQKKADAELEAWEAKHPLRYSKWNTCTDDFEFSDDYKFIVPREVKPLPPNQYWYNNVTPPGTPVTLPVNQ